MTWRRFTIHSSTTSHFGTWVLSATKAGLFTGNEMQFASVIHLLAVLAHCAASVLCWSCWKSWCYLSESLESVVNAAGVHILEPFLKSKWVSVKYSPVVCGSDNQHNDLISILVQCLDLCQLMTHCCSLLSPFCPAFWADGLLPR